MKHESPCTFDGCGQGKNGARHVGIRADHDYAAPAKEGFGSRRQELNARSEKTREYYRTVRRPEVSRMIGNGRQRCPGKAAGIGVCTGFVQGIHEVLPRGRAGGLKPAAAGQTIACCHACNGWASEHPKEAAAIGWLRSATLDGTRARNAPTPQRKRPDTATPAPSGPESERPPVRGRSLFPD